MTKIVLKSKTRDVVGKRLNKYREEGLIPAVVYGHKVTPQNLWVDFMEFNKTYDQAGESTIIELDIDGKNKTNVLIHDTQSDPLTDKFSHIDFFQIKMDEKIETEIPLKFINNSPAVKGMGGILVKTIDAISIRCLPADLPSKIEVDISKLKTFDDCISIKDLEVPDKVKVLINANT
ncbi:MAG TPA: 50S ribosomal protein L25, partial [Candidatus Moranbacteria bacterium]|nr:50S ribosomal protein L25 [Candidatus Moranbacteria bacterium]